MHRNELPASTSILSNNVDNITSIIDCFENDKFYETCETNLGCLLGVDIKSELDNILLGINSKLIPCVLNDAKNFDKKELQDSLEKIRLIKQKFSKLYKFLKAVRHNNYQGNYNFVCNTCEQVISRKPLSNTWSNLQHHDHFKEAFLHLLTPEDPQCNEILNNNSNSIDNTSTSSIMAEIPKTSALSVSENESTSATTISEYSINENINSTELTLQTDIISKKKLNCDNCGLQTNDLPDFKFNFKIMYDPMIERVMYWPKVAFTCRNELLDEMGQPFLQFKAKQLFTCLLCNCDIPTYIDYSIIRQHIQGNRHIRKKSTASIIQSLFTYHENWKQQEPSYQAHQTYFLPFDNWTTLCVPCGRKGTVVPYDSLKDHINSEKHKDTFMRSNLKAKSKRFFDCILNLQAEVYANLDEGRQVPLNNCDENGYEKELREKFQETTETNTNSEENQPVTSNINKQLSTTIKGTYCTEEKFKNNVIELNSAEGSQASKNRNTGALIKTKLENHPSTSESDSTDARLQDNSNVTLNIEVNSKSEDSPIKSKQKKHEIVKSIANPSGTELRELLELRFLPHMTCFTISGIQTANCKNCKAAMANHHKVIRQHICSKEHQLNSNIPHTTYQFYCEICNVILRQERRWEDHLKQLKHIERCERLGASRKNNITEYQCETCKLVIFGDDLSIKRHSASAARSGRFSKVKEIVLGAEVKNLFKSGQYIQEQSLLLVREANKVLLNQDPVQKCCLALQTALADVYPNCRAYPFGSRVSGLGSERSDLDVFVDMGDMYMGDKKQDPRNQEKFVINACKIFRKKKEEFSHVNPIPTARTPIVQVYHMMSKLDCDLSFRHGLSVENTKFLRLCIDLQPIAQSLILLLKQWVAHCKLQEHMTTYALCMMVIFHLQVGGYLTPVHELRQLNPDNVFVIDGWGVVDFSKSVSDLRERIVPYHGSVAEMLKEFFYYYSKFNYTTDVICPLLGRPIKKVLFLDKPKGEDLPLEMLAYVRKVSATDAEYFRARSPFCIQDPFDLSHNLVKACNPGVVDKLKTFCDLTLKHFTSIC